MSSVKLVERLQKMRAETRREPHEVVRYGEVLLKRKTLDSGDDEGEHSGRLCHAEWVVADVVV